MKKPFLLLALVTLIAQAADAALIWKHCDNCAGVQITKIRVQPGDVWFKVAGDNLLYGFSISTDADSRNLLTVLMNAKATGQAITFRFDDASWRYGTNVGRTVDGIELR